MDLVSDPDLHTGAGVYLSNICCTWSREGGNTHTRYSRNSFALKESVPKGIIHLFHSQVILSLNTWLNRSNFMQELRQLTDDIRSELLFIMSKTGKPLKASLEVVELTVAMHYVFHSPIDKILWDVEEHVSCFSSNQIVDP